MLKNILLVPPKYEIIMVLSNYSLYHYCDSNLAFSILFLVKLSLLNFIAFILLSMEKEQQLYGEQYRKEAMNECTKHIQKMNGRATSFAI